MWMALPPRSVPKIINMPNPGVEATPWGSRETQLSDPFGNKLIFFTSAPAPENP
jgi:hypothetical protein